MFKQLIAVFFLIFIICACDYNSEQPGKYHKLINKIELHSKDYNIEWYIDTYGGVYARNYYVLFKAYSDGGYDKIYAKISTFMDIESVVSG